MKIILLFTWANLITNLIDLVILSKFKNIDSLT